MERIFIAENGQKIIAINEIQAEVFLSEGFKEVTEEDKKKK
jgi:hypothetical protein